MPYSVSQGFDHFLLRLDHLRWRFGRRGQKKMTGAKPRALPEVLRTRVVKVSAFILRGVALRYHLLLNPLSRAQIVHYVPSKPPDTKTPPSQDRSQVFFIPQFL